MRMEKEEATPSANTETAKVEKKDWGGVVKYIHGGCICLIVRKKWSLLSSLKRKWQGSAVDGKMESGCMEKWAGNVKRLMFTGWDTQHRRTAKTG